MTQPSTQRSPDEEAELQARLESAKRTTNIMLLGLVGFVVAGTAFGLYQLVAMIIKNS